MSVKYPIGAKTYTPTTNKKSTPNFQKSRLGTNFEDAINQSNEYYLLNDVAVIHKKPTPIQITKVDYPSRHSAKITEAFYKIPSTTDYNGIYKGCYVDFEAKSCNGASFPFSHLYVHQIHHLEAVNRHGGISFLIIRFNDKDEVFILPTPILLEKYEDSLKGGRKSLTYDFIKANGALVKTGYAPLIDYLKTIDMLYFNK